MFTEFSNLSKLFEVMMSTIKNWNYEEFCISVLNNIGADTTIKLGVELVNFEYDDQESDTNDSVAKFYIIEVVNTTMPTPYLTFRSLVLRDCIDKAILGLIKEWNVGLSKPDLRNFY